MGKSRSWFFVAIGTLLAAAVSMASAAEHADDQASIRRVLMTQFDKPEARLQVNPVVIAGDSAIASWSQGERGGRALLFREGREWRVAVCGGDGLTESKVLREAGVKRSIADELLRGLRVAEARLPASQRAKFSTFDGLVRIDAGGNHPTERRH